MPKPLYRYMDHLYEIVDVALTKDPITRDWVTYVVYKRPHDKTLYAREETEFHEKFIQDRD